MRTAGVELEGFEATLAGWRTQAVWLDWGGTLVDERISPADIWLSLGWRWWVLVEGKWLVFDEFEGSEIGC